MWPIARGGFHSWGDKMMFLKRILEKDFSRKKKTKIRRCQRRLTITSYCFAFQERSIWRVTFDQRHCKPLSELQSLISFENALSTPNRVAKNEPQTIRPAAINGGMRLLLSPFSLSFPTGQTFEQNCLWDTTWKTWRFPLAPPVLFQNEWNLRNACLLTCPSQWNNWPCTLRRAWPLRNVTFYILKTRKSFGLRSHLYHSRENAEKGKRSALTLA